MRCRYFFFSPIAFTIYSHFFFHSLLVVSQIRGHIAGSSILMGACIWEICTLCYEEKAQIGQTNRILGARKMKNEARLTRRLAYTWHSVVRNTKRYNLSKVLSRLLLCYAYAGGQQFTMPSPLLKNVTNAYYAYLVGPFAEYLWEVLCVVSSHVTFFFAKHPKTRNIRLKTVQCWAEKK